MLYKLVNYRSLSGALGNGAIQKGEGEMKISGIVTSSLHDHSVKIKLTYHISNTNRQPPQSIPK